MAVSDSVVCLVVLYKSQDIFQLYSGIKYGGKYFAVNMMINGLFIIMWLNNCYFQINYCMKLRVAVKELNCHIFILSTSVVFWHYTVEYQGLIWEYFPKFLNILKSGNIVF